MYNIPLFGLNYDNRELKAIEEVLSSKWISSGPKCEELEKKFASMLGVNYAISLSNCTAALHLALLSLGIGYGDEVIVPSMTFVATVNAIRYVGAIPVFCDIEGLERPVIGPENIGALITEKTRGIIVMHYGGFSCDMDGIMNLAKIHNIKVVEDACHGPLSEYNNQKLGTIGDVGCFSFFSNKNISTGEGGMVVSNSMEIYEKIKLLKSHGMTSLSYDRANGHSTGYDVVELGYNYRLDDIRAALAMVQMDKLREDIGKRQDVRKRYIDNLSAVNDIIIPFKDYKIFSSCYIFPLVLKEHNESRRNSLRCKLAEKGIQTSVHYPPAHRFSIYKEFNKGDLPNTNQFADSEFTVPMFGKLSMEQVDYVCDTLIESLGEL